MPHSVKSIYFTLGLICILFGTALVGFATYGILTNDTFQQWIYIRPAQPTPAAAGVSQQPDSSPLGDGPYRLVIDKLGVDAPIATFGLDENAVPQVPYDAALVAWYDFSSSPGTGSNAVFAGHKTWRGDAVFLKLEDLNIGDDIELRGEDGGQILYRVSETVLVDPADRSALDWMKATETDSVTLITCGGTWFETNDFAGADYTLRVVVRADRVDASVASALDSQPGG
ncbi:MAG: class F sortase [Chloroflexi bacterium]|nr:class F sortase [Chloroflexota bacterium]